MQGFVDLIAGLVAALAVAALAQFGVDLQVPASSDREVRRTADCPDAPSAQAIVITSRRDC